MNLNDRYRRIRRENRYMPADHAIAVARRQVAPQWAEDMDYNAYTGWVGTVDNFHVEIRTEVDDIQDISWLGTFTDDPTDAIPNPEYQHGRFKFFRPDVFQVESLESLRRQWGRTQAAEIRAIRLDQTVRTALDTQYTIIVDVYDPRENTYIGTTSLGGCFWETAEDILWHVHDNDLIEQAASADGADMMAAS